MALATVVDLQARLGRTLTAEETTQATALLDDASALVRSYTRQTFDQVLDDPIILRNVADHVRLPQRPVLDVAEVRLIDVDGQPSDSPIGHRWDGSDKVYIRGSIIAGLDDPWWPWNITGPITVQVTYSHGYATVPDDVVAVVCAMVLRVLAAPSQVEGMVSERIGQYFYQLQQGSGAAGLSVRMSSADKDALAKYRRTTGTIQVRA